MSTLCLVLNGRLSLQDSGLSACLADSCSEHMVACDSRACTEAAARSQSSFSTFLTVLNKCNEAIDTTYEAVTIVESQESPCKF